MTRGIWAEAWHNLPTTARIMVVAVAVFVGIYIGLVLYGDAQSHRAHLAEDTARTEQAISKRLAEQAALADQRATVAERKALALAATVENLKQRLASIPVPVRKPVPVDPKEFGLQEPPKDEPDKILIWKWKEDSEALPAWTAKYDACMKVSEAQDQQIQAQVRAIQDLGTARDTWHLTADSAGRRAESLQTAVTALNREIKSQQKRKWMLVGAAIVTGYIAGKHK